MKLTNTIHFRIITSLSQNYLLANLSRFLMNCNSQESLKRYFAYPAGGERPVHAADSEITVIGET